MSEEKKPEIDSEDLNVDELHDDNLEDVAGGGFFCGNGNCPCGPSDTQGPEE